MSDQTRTLSDDEKKKVSDLNKETLDKLSELQKAVEKLAADKEGKMEQTAKRTFRLLEFMIVTAFVVGLILIGTALWSAVLGNNAANALGFGSGGVVDWIAVLLYDPMDKLQAADKYYLQQIILLRAWVMSVNLELLAMDSTQRATILTASQDMRTAAAFAAKSLQDFIGQPSKSTGTGAQAQSGQTAPPKTSST